MRSGLLSAVAFALTATLKIGFAQDTPLVPPAPSDVRVGAVTLEELDEDFNKLQNQVTELLGQRQAMLNQQRLNRFLGADVPAEDFMPPPADPSNLFFNEANLADVNLGAGSRVGGTGLIFRAAETGSVLMRYDTGVVGSGSQFDPSTIFPGGSAAQGAGNFDLSDLGGTFKFDLNAPIAEGGQAQAFLDTAYLNGDLSIRHAFGRVNLTTVDVLAGTYWTAWADEGTIPKSITGNGLPAGTNTQQGVAQLRLAIPTESGWVTTFAIQQAASDVIAIRAMDDARLRRYPDLATRIRYFDGDFFSLSFGGIVHAMGRENPALDEDFTTGWGLTAATRFRTSQCGGLMLGVVSGKGIAGSIFGLSDSLAADNTAVLDLAAVTNYGAYAGYQHQLTKNLLSTVAYGIAHGAATTAAMTTRQSQNAWANIIYKANESFAYGFQYDYGDRNLVNGTNGDNHRISLVVSVTLGQGNKVDGNAAADAVSGDSADANSLRDEIRRNVPPETGRSKYRRL
jgi:hypothetical protein